MSDQKDKKFEIIDILETVTIIFRDGKKELYDAIQLDTNKGVITGNIIEINKVDILSIINNEYLLIDNELDCSKMFIGCGFIPMSNIDRIEVRTRKKVLKEKY